MNPLLLTAVFDVVSKLTDRLFPDPAQKAAAQLELLKMQQAGEFKQADADLQLALGQIDVNKIEAAAPDFFTRGWRPAVGWVCVSGLAYEFLLRPLLIGFALAAAPELPMGDLLALLSGLLGLGVLRTAEKLKGVA